MFKGENIDICLQLPHYLHSVCEKVGKRGRERGLLVVVVGWVNQWG